MLRVGQKKDFLTIVDNLGGGIYLCQCDCGETIKITGRQLKSHKACSCGCAKRKGSVAYAIQVKENIAYRENTILDIADRLEKGLPLFRTDNIEPKTLSAEELKRMQAEFEEYKRNKKGGDLK